MLPRRWMEAYINFLLRKRWLVLGLAVVLTVFFVYQLPHTRVQMNFLDFYPPGHPYNVAYDRIIDREFAGISQLVVIAEGAKPGTFRTVEALHALERFQRHMEHSNALAGGSVSGADIIRQIYQRFEEGIPKWAILPKKSVDIGNMFAYFLMSAGAPALERFVDKDLQNATVTVFFRDYQHDTVMQALSQAKEYIASNPIQDVEFRLAGGLFGILAAINEEVEWSYRVNLSLVLATVFVLSLLIYRSLTGALIVMIPSIVAQLLTEAIMYWSRIDMNVNSLPVAAIGIGIDYGYYVLSRITEECANFGDIDQAIEQALMTTGRAILFTGTTLTASVIFWLFFPMKFQAEMAFLLALVLFLHIIGALVFIPSMVSLLKPRFTTVKASAVGQDGAASPAAVS